MKLKFWVPIIILLQSCFLTNKGIDPELEIPTFNPNPQIYQVDAASLDEASGIVPSKNMPNLLWINEDSDTKAGLFLINNQGKYQNFVPFSGTNRDWEDLGYGPGPNAGINYLYIADIGDNNVVYKEYYIYRFPEPNTIQTQISNYETIKFQYPNGVSFNSETFFVDPTTKDWYILTKDQLNVNVFRLPFPQSTTTLMTAEFLGTIPYPNITGGDISADGKEILLKNYFAIYYWKKKSTETIYQAMTRNRDTTPPYVGEKQGESICWDLDTKGYYTISERSSEVNYPPLYYYSKVIKE